MELVAAGWRMVKYLRLDQTIRNLTCGNYTGSNQLVKDQLGVLPGLVWGKGEE